MSYRITRVDPCIFVAWETTPARADVERLARELSEQVRAWTGRAQLWVVIDTQKVDVPDSDARDAFQKKLKGVVDECDAMNVVLLGTGLRTSLLRTLLRGMAIVTRISDRVRVFDSVESASAARGIVGQTRSTLEAMAR